MRKFLFLSSISLFLALSSCQKETSSSNESFIPKNQTATVSARNGIKIVANDVYSKKSSFRRQLNFIDPTTKTSFETFYLTFISSQNVDIYEQMKKRPETVNGIFTIETNGQTIFKKSVINGIGQSGERIQYDVSLDKNATQVPCNISTVHDCVAYEIDDMNWIEYGLCAASAPGCYAGLWASCTWEVCHNGHPH